MHLQNYTTYTNSAMRADLLYLLAITRIPGVGAVTAKNLISYCGGAEEVFRSKRPALLAVPGIGPVTVDSILRQQVLQEAEEELAFIHRENLTAISYLDQDYPTRLRKYPDCPLVLFYRGNVSLQRARTVAIVGTRKPTAQGIAVCEELVRELVPYQPLIISGLAYGIDITAHRTSLDVGLPTLGVLAHGLDRIYPAAHRKTARQMVERGGLLTEFCKDTIPDRENFPMRNRIVAGLADAIIVVESARRGGSIITAQLGISYSKDVFAVPGRLRDKYSEGCNDLIRSNKATLLQGAEDIARMLNWETTDTETADRQQALFVTLTDSEKSIIDLLQQREEIGVDQLGYELELNNNILASLLLELEFKGIVKSLPGKRYILS